MTLRSVFSFRNIDSTHDLNSRFATLFAMGVYSGGVSTPIPSTLQISITPFLAMSSEGMLVTDPSATTLTVLSGVNNYICLDAKYNPTGTPTLQWLVLDYPTYAAHADYAYLIVFCTINVPVGAIAVTSAMISTIAAHQIDTIGRFVIRGTIPSIVNLPVVNNRVSDAYIITNGLSDIPALYIYNGTTFINVTQSGSVSATLQLHRQNLFANEIHLTNNQADALIGTSGNPPNLANPYVDSLDPRLPTQNQKNALAGVLNSINDYRIIPPTDTNRYMTESRQFAVPSEVSYVTGPNLTYIIFNVSNGPAYVGTISGVTSALKYFQLYNLDENINQEYITSTGAVPNLIGIYTDAGLTIALDPATMTIPPAQLVPAGFFLTGNLYLVFDQIIDTGFRLSFLKQSLLTQVAPSGFNIRKPSDIQISSKLLYTDKIQNFFLISPTNTLTLNPSIFSMHTNSYVYDVKVYENGVFLPPEDGTFDPIIIQLGNDVIDFVDSFSITRQCILTHATYSTLSSLAALATDIATQMSAVSPDIITTSFNPNYWTFTIADSTGNFQLLCNSGVATFISPWSVLGFDIASDKIGAATYTGSFPISKSHIGWFKLSSTSIWLINQGHINGLFTVEKQFNL